MTEEDPAGDLSRLHDIVEPESISWWPLSPGWYVLAGVVLVVGAMLGVRLWRRWKASAFRREALGELERSGSPSEIAALIRRTALATFPRSEIAGLSGDAWVDWLARNGTQQPPDSVRELLTKGIYKSSGPLDTGELKNWAETWIRHHRAHGETGGDR